MNWKEGREKDGSLQDCKLIAKYSANKQSFYTPAVLLNIPW